MHALHYFHNMFRKKARKKTISLERPCSPRPVKLGDAFHGIHRVVAPMCKAHIDYLEPFRRDSSVWWIDRRTARRTDIIVTNAALQYIAQPKMCRYKANTRMLAYKQLLLQYVATVKFSLYRMKRTYTHCRPISLTIYCQWINLRCQLTWWGSSAVTLGTFCLLSACCCCWTAVGSYVLHLAVHPSLRAFFCELRAVRMLKVKLLSIPFGRSSEFPME